MRHIAGNIRVRREERQIGIDARRDRVIIAGAKMHIGTQLLVFAAHDKRHFSVCFQLDEAEHHLNASAFQIARPADVCFLIEAGFQLDQRRHRLASFGCIHQRTHDRAVVGGAVKRLLDGQHVRVGCGLPQELHHHVEGFIGMMDHDVLFANRSEAVAAMFANTFRKARVVGYEFEVFTRDRNDLRNHVQRQQSFVHADPVFRNAKFRRDEDAQSFRHFTVELDADHLTTAAALQRCLEEANQIFRLFLDFDIAVADDTERTGATHFITGEKPSDEQAHCILDGDEAVVIGLIRRQLNKAFQRNRDAQERRHRMIIGAPRKLQSDGEAQIGDERERMRRIDGKRRQDRENRFEEVVFKPFLFRF